MENHESETIDPISEDFGTEDPKDLDLEFTGPEESESEESDEIFDDTDEDEDGEQKSDEDKASDDDDLQKLLDSLSDTKGDKSADPETSELESLRQEVQALKRELHGEPEDPFTELKFSDEDMIKPDDLSDPDAVMKYFNTLTGKMNAIVDHLKQGTTNTAEADDQTGPDEINKNWESFVVEKKIPANVKSEVEKFFSDPKNMTPENMLRWFAASKSSNMRISKLPKGQSRQTTGQSQGGGLEDTINDLMEAGDMGRLKRFMAKLSPKRYDRALAFIESKQRE